MNHISSFSRVPRVAMLVGVLACAVLLAAGCGARRSQQYSQEGDTYFRLGKIDDAETAYTRAEEANPENAMAKAGLGRVHLARKEYDKALDKYIAAVQLDASLEGYAAEAVQTLLRADRAEDAFRLADEFSKVNPTQGGQLKAYLLRESGRAEEAVRLLQELAVQAPDNPGIHISLAKTHLAANQPDQAEAALQKALALPGVDAVAARMVAVDAFAAQRRLPALIAQFREQLAESPGDAALQLALARALVENGEVDEARTLAAAVLEKNPESPWAMYVLGASALAENNAADAAAQLEAAARALPGESAVLRRLGAAQAGLRGGMAPAEPPAKGAEESAAAESAAEPPATWQELWAKAELRRLLEGRAAFASDEAALREALFLAAVFTQDAALAKTLGQELPPDSPLAGYLTLLEERDHAKIAPFFEKWTGDSAESQVMRGNALAFALASIGGRSQAVQALSQVMESVPQNGVALYNMAQVFRAARMPRYAGRTLERLIGLALDNDEAHTLLFVVYREGGLNDEARKAAESAYSLFPKNPQMIMNLAQAYLDDGDRDLALQVLKRGAGMQPDNAQLQVALAGVYLHAGQLQQGMEILNGFAPPEGAAQEVQTLRAFVAALQGDWAAVAAVAAQDDAVPANLPRRLLGFAAQYKQGDMEKAAATLRPATGEQPAAIERAILGALGTDDAGLSGDGRSLAAALRGQAALSADLAFAEALASGRFHEEAVPRFRELVQKLGPEPMLLDSLFHSLASSPGMENRLEVAKEIAASHAASPGAQVGLAAVYRAAGDVTGEGVALEAAVKADPKSIPAWQARAQYLDRQGRVKDALAAYEALIALDPDNPATNNNLAYCLLTADGDAGKALAHAQKAAEKMRSNPYVLHTLGLAQMRTGQLDESQKNLAVALQLLPADPTLLLDYGLLMMRMGKDEDGVSSIGLAIRYADQLGLDFPRRAEAEKVLAASKKPDTPS